MLSNAKTPVSKNPRHGALQKATKALKVFVRHFESSSDLYNQNQPKSTKSNFLQVVLAELGRVWAEFIVPDYFGVVE